MYYLNHTSDTHQHSFFIKPFIDMKPFFLTGFILLNATLFSIAQRVTPSPGGNTLPTVREVRSLEHPERKIDVFYQKNRLGEYEFMCDNRTFISYIVEVNFSTLENLQADVSLPFRGTVAPGTQHIFTLRKSLIGEAAHLTYHFKTFKGCANPHVDTAFTYLLPVAPGKETRIFELDYIAKEYVGESAPKNWYALGLYTQAGDTVFAARRGRVTEVRDHASLQDSGYTFARGENFVEIFHNDCSFAKYQVFRDSSVFVHPGDFVEAGQPLGLAGGDKYDGGPQVRFSVYYNQEQEAVDKNGEKTGKILYWAYVPLQFWIKDKGKIRLINHATYTSEHPAQVITMEMSKKEAKKWTNSHTKS
jgi:Peptidase family M23